MPRTKRLREEIFATWSRDYWNIFFCKLTDWGTSHAQPAKSGPVTSEPAHLPLYRTRRRYKTRRCCFPFPLSVRLFAGIGPQVATAVRRQGLYIRIRVHCAMPTGCWSPCDVTCATSGNVEKRARDCVARRRCRIHRCRLDTRTLVIIYFFSNTCWLLIYRSDGCCWYYSATTCGL